MQNGIFTLRGALMAPTTSIPDRNIGAKFPTLRAHHSFVNGAAPASDARNWSPAPPRMKWRNGFALAATSRANSPSVTRSYAGKGVVKRVGENRR